MSAREGGLAVRDGAGARLSGPRGARKPGARRRGVTLVLLGSIVVSFLAASAAPTPMYALYAAQWRFSALATTVVFGVYALAVLAGLLTFGRLSDHTGRRPVLLAGIAVQAVATVLFITAGGLETLLIARVVQGLATGASLGAIGAGMLDLDRRRGAVANSFAPGVGTASGALVSALAVQYLPDPTHLIYLVLLGVFGVQAAGRPGHAGDGRRRRPGALRSLVPDVRLPAAVRGEVAIAAPVLLAVWALAGFYGSLGPALTAALLHSTSVVYGGLSLFILAGVAAGIGAGLEPGRTPPGPVPEHRGAGGRRRGDAGGRCRRTRRRASSPAPPSPGSASAAASRAGSGWWSRWPGERERAGVLSLLYIVSYLGLGVPAVIGGRAGHRGERCPGDGQGVRIGRDRCSPSWPWAACCCGGRRRGGDAPVAVGCESSR